ncbi:hypothetical protein GCM10011613_25370 [Cellvibrio zantedeschiae]|uniref:Uncharacterized protein n=1 Tax=Cellvibrio zantedeschiae TaxID=1237077 RepID=A0ABQ3B4Z0_9GAMM|nr:hypothetical protein [Cellvibrio zantedeschiae]GGY79445.1 hypothetical protein GCM10011613_25370 [Cellvibrio zantedeschiae]
MKTSFNLSEFRTVSADMDLTISIEVADSRVPDNKFIAQDLTLEQYNECVEFFRAHDHIFAMNMAKEKFCK